MDNENIKEILDFDFESQGERIEINEYERNILKDYITNLQEEYKKSCETYQQALDETMSEKMDLEKENERLYKELEKADSITQSCIFEGSRSAGKSYRQCLNWLEDYKSRNEKAIEFIKEKQESTDIDEVINTDILLNILGGDE